VTTSDARTKVRPSPCSGTTSTQSPSNDVPLTPKLLTQSSASSTPSKSRFFPFVSVMATFTVCEGYGALVPGVHSTRNGRLGPNLRRAEDRAMNSLTDVRAKDGSRSWPLPTALGSVRILALPGIGRSNARSGSCR
jgi:hypothetical protein